MFQATATSPHLSAQKFVPHLSSHVTSPRQCRAQKGVSLTCMSNIEVVIPTMSQRCRLPPPLPETLSAKRASQRSRPSTLFFPAFAILLFYSIYLTIMMAVRPHTPHTEKPLRAAAWAGFTGSDRGSSGRSSGTSPSVLAFYFPQFYEFEENNRFWGKGFTDLTNVKRVRRNRNGQPVIRPGERNGVALWAYNQAWESHRRFQGVLAKAYEVDGFVIMHYWFDDHPVMEAPLQGRLKDGQPAIPYCIFWANEHWTKKWDGLDGSEMLLKQTYNQSTWLQHLRYLIPFFQDPSYIKVDGKPMFVVYRASDIPDFPAMLQMWDVYLTATTDIPGLHVVQILGSKWTEASHSLAAGAAGFVEYYPNLYNGGQWPVSRILSTSEPNPKAKHYYGVSAAWDNTPRHLTDGTATVFPNHPSVFQYTLQQNLARTEPGSYVFVNAWNEWGEGAAIESSIEWGRRWLEAVKQAKANVRLGHVMGLNSKGQPVKLKLPPAGVTKSSTSSSMLRSSGRPATGCIVVRTFEGHEGAMFNIHQFISTLLALNTKSWEAFFLNTDAQPYANLGAILSSYDDPRLQLAALPSTMDRTYVAAVSAYHLVDWAISSRCDTAKHDWMLVTNADNWYTPDALDYMPSGFDMVLMNFYGRYNPINDMRFGNGTAVDSCCERLYTGNCFYAAPKIGFIDLGATIFNLHKYKALGINFMKYTGACGAYSCHDGALVQSLVDEHHWSYVSHDLGVCALYHNSNPQSCALIGGVYYDSLDYGQAGCYDLTALPLGWGDIKWDAFVSSKAACICQRYDIFSQMFVDP